MLASDSSLDGSGPAVLRLQERVDSRRANGSPHLSARRRASLEVGGEEADGRNRKSWFRAALDLALLGVSQPSGYTEPILHERRKAAKLVKQFGLGGLNGSAENACARQGTSR